MAANDNGTTNENDTVHFKEWVTAIFSVTKTDTLLSGMDACNKIGQINRMRLKNECIRKVFQKDSWSEQNNYLFHITPERMNGKQLLL